MALDRELVGRSYPPSAVYEVGRAKIAEFATAIGADSPLHRDVDARELPVLAGTHPILQVTVEVHLARRDGIGPRRRSPHNPPMQRTGGEALL